MSDIAIYFWAALITAVIGIWSEDRRWLWTAALITVAGAVDVTLNIVTVKAALGL
ncbi:hypothetical protein SCMU_14080 [Sinomonas cyclohexanicum]|uniref:Uncharacterized protein n=1 Tax=Sinomonas cyclohexanicum TaxID=322009 RepID=A0ABM7PTS5_SINCY|nr:hypothetical protein [Corynebacterium cyclohexanicum]BCT75566.1 hypothetical protein SCMU_14080 [Corynebacterium cyclohexanicum]